MKFILLPLTFITLASVACNKKEGTTAATVSESNIKPYPLATCLVSKEKLGSMGDPIVINHEGQEIKFCCDSCVPKFKKDTAKYLLELKSSSNE